MSTAPKQSKGLRAATPLIWRLVALVGLFIVLSASVGQHIIGNGLVNKDGFQIYGGAGKALLFAVLALALLTWRRGLDVKLQPWRPVYAVWLGLALVALGLAWHSVDELIAGSQNLGWILLAHFGILASVALAATAVFGISDLKLLGRTYKRELLISLGLFVAFFVFVYIIYGLWTVLATVVLHSVRFLLEISGLNVAILPPRTLILDTFGIQVAQFCSGIESIALFTALYALIGVLDWRRFNHTRYFYAFPIALVLLFALNILRVYGLVMAGYYINPQIAFSLFHSYAGMLFFIIYSIAFWAVAYRWMLAKAEG